LTASGEFEARRRHQALAWMWQQIDSGLRQRFREHPAVKSALAELSVSVEAGSHHAGCRRTAPARDGGPPFLVFDRR
jgi:putative protein kinase ArgK-like GTPase of G3E family